MAALQRGGCTELARLDLDAKYKHGASQRYLSETTNVEQAKAQTESGQSGEIGCKKESFGLSPLSCCW
jgi:hypothetical protein